MFLRFEGDFDLLIPMLNDASAYILSVFEIWIKNHILKNVLSYDYP